MDKRLKDCKAIKKNNGYRLHTAGHIDNVKNAYQVHPDFPYFVLTCTPVARQNTQPYNVWVLFTCCKQLLPEVTLLNIFGKSRDRND